MIKQNKGHYFIKIDGELVPSLLIASDILSISMGYLRNIISKNKSKVDTVINDKHLVVEPFIYKFKTPNQRLKEKLDKKKQA